MEAISLKKQYNPSSLYLTLEKEPRFLSLDAFAPQIIKSLCDEFKKVNTITSYILEGCIRFVQVLDVSLNQLMERLVAQATSDHANEYHKRYIKGVS